MDRTAIVKIVAALVAVAALVCLGALLPKPIGGQASLAPSDPVLGQASLAPDSTVSVGGQASLPPSDPVLGQASLAQVLLHVYVCGAVRNPGVYTLSAGTRIVDAIARAGGAAKTGDLEQLNLAEPLTDAMKIDVPIKGQSFTPPIGAPESAQFDSPPSASSGHSSRHRSSRGGSHKLSAGQTLNINTASESELTQLPGVGPSLARRIVEYRTANGPFQMADDLQNVSGIGPSKFAKMEPFIRV